MYTGLEMSRKLSVEILDQNPCCGLETFCATKEDQETTAVMLRKAAFCFTELQWLRSVSEPRLLGNL